MREAAGEYDSDMVFDVHVVFMSKMKKNDKVNILRLVTFHSGNHFRNNPLD